MKDSILRKPQKVKKKNNSFLKVSYSKIKRTISKKNESKLNIVEHNNSKYETKPKTRSEFINFGYYNVKPLSLFSRKIEVLQKEEKKEVPNIERLKFLKFLPANQTYIDKTNSQLEVNYDPIIDGFVCSDEVINTRKKIFLKLKQENKFFSNTKNEDYNYEKVLKFKYAHNW